MGKPDRFTKVLLCLLVVGVWGLLLAPFIQVQPVEAQGKTSSVKWEYAFTSSPATIEELDALGNRGWEAAGIEAGQVLLKRRR